MKALQSIIFTIVSMIALVPHCQGMLTFSLSGLVSELNLNESEGDFSIGQSWHLEINYDENTPDSTQWTGEWTGGIDSDETRGSYAMIDFRFVTSGLALETNNVGIEVLNNRTAIEVPSEEFIVFDSMSFNPHFGGSFPIFTGNPYSFTLSFFDRSAEVFNSDALPISTLDLSLFDSSNGTLSWLNGLGGESLSLQTTSFAIIPEPSRSTFGMAILSLFIVSSLRSRRSRKIEQT